MVWAGGCSLITWKRGKPLRLACFLALLVSRLQSDANIRPGRADRTGVVPANEFALFACSDYQASAFLLQISHEICVGKFPCAFTDLSSGQMWLTKNIEIVGFDNQMTSVSWRSAVTDPGRILLSAQTNFVRDQ